MGIPRQGIKTASTGLPDIQTDRILPSHEKSYTQKSLTIINLLIFSKIFVERKKAVCLRRLHEL